MTFRGGCGNRRGPTRCEVFHAFKSRLDRLAGDRRGFGHAGKRRRTRFLGVAAPAGVSQRPHDAGQHVRPADRRGGLRQRQSPPQSRRRGGRDEKPSRVPRGGKTLPWRFPQVSRRGTAVQLARRTRTLGARAAAARRTRRSPQRRARAADPFGERNPFEIRFAPRSGRIQGVLGSSRPVAEQAPPGHRAERRAYRHRAQTRPAQRSLFDIPRADI